MKLSEHIKRLEEELEQEPADQQRRLILADAYETIGDPLAETLRWMADGDFRPWSGSRVSRVSWCSGPRLRRSSTKSYIPESIFNLLKDGVMYGKHARHYNSVRDATLDLHEALLEEATSSH